MPRNNLPLERDARIGVRLPTDLRERIESLAREEQRSLSNMIVRLLTDALAARGGRRRG